MPTLAGTAKIAGNEGWDPAPFRRSLRRFWRSVGAVSWDGDNLRSRPADNPHSGKLPPQRPPENLDFAWICLHFNRLYEPLEKSLPPHHPPPHRSVTALALGKARAIAAPCHPAPRQRLRHWLYRPFAAHPAIQRVRALTAWRKGVASLRAVGASLSGSPVAKVPSRQRRLLPCGLSGYTFGTLTAVAQHA